MPARSSVGGDSEASFMSGSGITISGSAPGCQLSMLSTLPPSEELPKNRFEVLTLKGSRGGAMTVACLSALRLRRKRQRVVVGLRRIGILRQWRRAHRLLKLGIERRGGLRRHRLRLRHRQRSGLGAEHGAVRGRGILLRRRGGRCCRLGRGRHGGETVALQRAIDLGEIGGLVTRRCLEHRIARNGAGDVAAIEAREANHRALRH